ERPSEFGCRRPEPSDLAVTQGTVAGSLSGRRPHPLNGRGRDVFLVERPIEECPQAGEDPICLYFGAAFRDAVEHGFDGAPGEAGDRARAPDRDQIDMENARRLSVSGGTRVFFHISDEVGLGSRGEAIRSYVDSLDRDALGSRVHALLDLA